MILIKRREEWQSTFKEKIAAIHTNINSMIGKQKGNRVVP